MTTANQKPEPHPVSRFKNAMTGGDRRVFVRKPRLGA